MSGTPLTLGAVAEHPDVVTTTVDAPGFPPVVVRPLSPHDVSALADFLQSLSPGTRRLSTFPDGFDTDGAQALCDAINRYDKLRFVVQPTGESTIIGLLELSFDVPDGDLERYTSAGMPLDAGTCVRFGPTLSDAYQGVGLGTAVLPHVIDVVRRFGRRRILLWGGVLHDNARALRYYEKAGFRRVAAFQGPDGQTSIDMVLDIAPPMRP